jgi:hypothetical protein
LSEAQLFPNPSEQTPRGPGGGRGRGGSPVRAILTAVLIAVGAGLLGKACSTGLFKIFAPAPRAVRHAPAETWRAYSPTGAHMTLELPGEPRRATDTMPAEVWDLVEKFESYRLERAEFLVTMNYMERVVSDRVITTEETARGTVESLRGLEEVSDLQYSVDRPGPSEVSFNGSFNRNDTPMEINGFARGQGRRVWVVLCIGRRHSAQAKSVSERVLGSVTTH